MNSSWSSSPNEYMSLATVTGSPRACSGLMQEAVPTTLPGAVRPKAKEASPSIERTVVRSGSAPVAKAVSSSSLTRAIPKSSTFTPPSRVSITLVDFRSRWMIPWEWAAPSTSAIRSAMASRSAVGNPRAMASFRVTPRISSRTRKSVSSAATKS